MISILEEFAYGNISPGPGGIASDLKYKDAAKKVEKITTALYKLLDDAGKEQMDNLVSAYNDLVMINGTGRFIHGFRLGVTMTAESFVGKRELIYGEDLGE